MSLINDALKKAQRQRTPDPLARPSAPEVSPTTPPAAQPYVYVRPARSGGPDPMLIKLGAIVGVVVIVGLVVALLWKSGGGDAPAKQPPAAVATVATPKSPEPAATANVPTVSASPTGANQSQPQFTLRPEPQPAANQPAVTPAVTPVATTPQNPAPEPPRVAAVKPDPRALTAIDGFKVLGVRTGAAAKDNKVLMNDRVYRLGDYVVPELGLKLTGVSPSTLTFEDSNGAIYTKSF